jgi:hypothetical protein
MYSEINKCCPSCCPASCLSTVVTLIRLYLLYCSLYFLSLTRSGYRVTAALSFSHVLCLSQLSQRTCPALQLLYAFSHTFTLQYAKTISFLLDRDSVNTALSFFLIAYYFVVFLFLICLQLAAVLSATHTILGRFIRPYCPDKNPQVLTPFVLYFFFVFNSVPSGSRVLLLCTSPLGQLPLSPPRPTCLWRLVNLSLQQQQPRSFVLSSIPMMRSNQLSGSASSRLRFAVAGIKTQKLRYTNSLASLPCGSPAISLQYTVSLVQWIIPSMGSAVHAPGMHKLIMDPGFYC